MQYVLVGTFRAHLLEGTDYIFSIEQILLYQETHFREEYVLYISNQTFSNSKLAFNFFKPVIFCLFWW